MPTQTEKNGMIHVETNHPRSSIVIIRAEDNEEKSKKLNRESSFVLPNIHNAIKNFEETDYFNQNSTDCNSNVMVKEDILPSEPYKERTEYIDHISDAEDKKDIPVDITDPDTASSKRESHNSFHTNDLDPMDANGDDGSSDCESVADSDPSHHESCLKQLYPTYEEKFE